MAPPIPRGNLVSPLVTDPTGKLYLLSCDVAGNLLTTALTDALKKADLVFNAAGSLIISGEDPSTLKPLPNNVIWSNTALPAGTSYYDLFTVPAGQIYNFTGAVIAYTGSMAGVQLSLYVTSGANHYQLIYTLELLESSRRYVYLWNIYLKAGDMLSYQINSATLNNDGYCTLWLSRIQ